MKNTKAEAEALKQQLQEDAVIQQIPITEIAADQMGKQLLQAMLDELKALQDPWAKTSQMEQDFALRRLEYRIGALVNQVIRTIAAREHTVLAARVESVMFKDGVKAVVSPMSGTSAVHDLADHVGADVILVITDAAEYLQGMSEIRGEADQRGLLDGDES